MIEGCECGFKAMDFIFKKTKGSCPTCGRAVLSGAVFLKREQLEAIKEKLPRREK